MRLAEYVGKTVKVILHNKTSREGYVHDYEDGISDGTGVQSITLDTGEKLYGLILSEIEEIQIKGNSERLTGMRSASKMDERVMCPCCGQEEVEEYDICTHCNWENDPIQRKNPDLAGGANRMSLNEAREIYAKGEKIP